MRLPRVSGRTIRLLIDAGGNLQSVCYHVDLAVVTEVVQQPLLVWRVVERASARSSPHRPRAPVAVLQQRLCSACRRHRAWPVRYPYGSVALFSVRRSRTSFFLGAANPSFDNVNGSFLFFQHRQARRRYVTATAPQSFGLAAPRSPSSGRRWRRSFQATSHPTTTAPTLDYACPIGGLIFRSNFRASEGSSQWPSIAPSALASSAWPRRRGFPR
jgi:hypothetical protein